MMPRLCTYSGCRTVVEGGESRCSQHPYVHTPKRRYDHHYHQGKAIYTSTRWKKLRAAYVRLHPFCVECEKFGIFTPVDDVDHIHEISDGGPIWDIDNLQGLCKQHHREKTGKEVRKRNQKKKQNGYRSLSDF